MLHRSVPSVVRAKTVRPDQEDSDSDRLSMTGTVKDFLMSEDHEEDKSEFKSVTSRLQSQVLLQSDTRKSPPSTNGACPGNQYYILAENFKLQEDYQEMSKYARRLMDHKTCVEDQLDKARAELEKVILDLNETREANTKLQNDYNSVHSCLMKEKRKMKNYSENSRNSNVLLKQFYLDNEEKLKKQNAQLRRTILDREDVILKLQACLDSMESEKKTIEATNLSLEKAVQVLKEQTTTVICDCRKMEESEPEVGGSYIPTKNEVVQVKIKID